jgi:hypothetical protein
LPKVAGTAVIAHGVYHWVQTSAYVVLGAIVWPGCGGEVRTVNLERIVPDADPACGAPADARTLRVAAVGEFPASDTTARTVEIGVGEALAIDAFPTETRALEVEVLGSGGTLRTVGRSFEFDAGALEGGEAIAVFMAPPDGVCPTGPPSRARSFAVIAASNEDIVVAGGFDAAAVPVARPEIYIHREGRFSELAQDTYSHPVEGLAGASLTSLPGGRLLLAGGPVGAFQVYDPGAGLFSEPPNLLALGRAFHAAVALDGSRVFLAGGCSFEDVADRACGLGTGLDTTSILDVDSGQITPGPSLASLRIGGQAFLEADGKVVLVGGIDGAGNPVDFVERLDPESPETPGELILDASGQGVLLDSGALIAAFAPPSAPAAGESRQVAPGGVMAVPLIAGTARAAPTLTLLESGQVIAFGGGDGIGAEAARLAPLRGRFQELEGIGMQGRRGHAAARLVDGSVLIVGGETASGEHLGDALVFRPELLGPLAGVVSVNFADDSQDRLIPRDRSATEVIDSEGVTPAHLEIRARATDEGLPGEWVVVAGPVLNAATFEMTASADAGLAIISSFESPATYRVAVIERGSPVRVLDVRSGVVTPTEDCDNGAAVPDAILASRTNWVYEVGDESIRLEADGELLIACEPPGALRPGRVGVGPLGPDGSVGRLFQLSVRR